MANTRQKKKRRYGLLLLDALLLGVLIFALVKLVTTLGDYRRSAERYDQIAEEAVRTAEPAPQQTAGPDMTAAPVSEVPITVDFDVLRAQNPDVVGWLYCADTPVNYPIVQGSDNDYYLDHAFDGSEDAGGTLFFDNRNRLSPLDQNLLLYGHRMKDDSMFGSVIGYTEQSYLEAHPVMYLITEAQSYRVEVYACRTVSANDLSYFEIVFADENGLPQMVNASGEIPAYGTVYELVAVPDYTVLHGDSKQENPDDVFYYNWLTEDDVLDLRIVDWEVSDTVLQDASDWVEQSSEPDASTGRLATVWNRSDTPIRFQAVAIYGTEQGGFVECTDYLPPAGVIMEESGGERPRYDGTEGNARAIVYAAEYLSPACKDQMTAAEIAQQGDALYQPDAPAYESCQVLITRAWFERS